MKFIRLFTIVPLALISLMNVGYPLGTDPKPDLLAAIVVAALGLAGFVAAFGLARNTTWGIPAAVAIAGLNVIGAVIALVADSEGAIVGLVISALALGLGLAAGSAQRKVAVA